MLFAATNHSVSPLAQSGGQHVAASRRDARRTDEPAGTRGAVRGTRSKKVDRQHDVDDLRGLLFDLGGLDALGLQHGLWTAVALRRDRFVLERVHRALRTAGDRGLRTGPGRLGRELADPVPLSDRDARLLPVRLRRHHPAPLLGCAGRSHQVQGVAAHRAAVDHRRLLRERGPALGWRLLRPEGRR